MSSTGRMRVLACVVVSTALLASVARPDAALPAAAASARTVWLAGTDGGVFALGDAPFLGGLGGVALRQPVIAIAGRASGTGYWMGALDGGVFAFGDAPFLGGLAGVRLNQPVVGIASTPSGNGYWLVAADGGVFAFGDATFVGSLAGVRLNAPISTFVPTAAGHGYWLLGRDGGIFAFGDAPFLGATLGTRDLATGVVPTQSGHGYWVALASGRVRGFGDASAIALPVVPATAVVGIATPWASSSGYGLPLLEALRAWLEALARAARATRTWVDAGEVALTFDDGPSVYTSQVLGVLAQYGVPATFFVVGDEVVARPDLVRAEDDAGMGVGNHTWDHPDLTRLDRAAVESELRRTSDAIEAAGGRRPKCFRPPYGATNGAVVSVAAGLGLTQVLWNVDPSDYTRPGAGVIASRVLSAATGRGLVVIMHDGGGDRSQTVAALPAIIEGLRARGYRFVALCR